MSDDCRKRRWVTDDQGVVRELVSKFKTEHEEQSAREQIISSIWAARERKEQEERFAKASKDPELQHLKGRAWVLRAIEVLPQLPDENEDQWDEALSKLSKIMDLHGHQGKGLRPRTIRDHRKPSVRKRDPRKTPRKSRK
jgi:hypothetical protein